MNARSNRTLSTALCILLTGSVGLGIMSFYTMGAAHANTAMVADADAGVGSDAGSAVASAPAPVHAATPTSFPDPTANPVSFATDAINLWHSAGWPAAVMLLVVGLLEALAWLGKNYQPLAWLGTGRKSIAIGGGVAVGLAALNALLGGGSWSAVLSAAGAAGLAYWHQAGTDPAKA